MRIVSLQPFLTETVAACLEADSLVGVSHRCDFPELVKKLPKVTAPRPSGVKIDLSQFPLIERGLTLDLLDLAKLKELAPELVLTRDLTASAQSSIAELRLEVKKELGEQCEFAAFDPRTYEQILSMFEEVGKLLGVPGEGLELASKAKAQAKDWIDNFYDRMRGKKVTFLSGTEPMLLGGLWIPDMISMGSAVSQHKKPGGKHLQVQWSEIVEFAPDVLIIAPGGLSLNSAVKRLPFFEALPDWEKIPAVKRGEVIFCDGVVNFSRPGPRIVESMGILVSAIAGLESGYITKRDSFYRLRWVELHRDKFKE